LMSDAAMAGLLPLFTGKAAGGRDRGQAARALPHMLHVVQPLQMVFVMAQHVPDQLVF
jgi:hypothetical protein